MRNRISKAYTLATSTLLAATLLIATPTHAAEINAEVAHAYNDGIQRCKNPECAKYLYACFRTYAGSNLDSFLVCGVQASRLNDELRVVANPSG